MKSMFVALFGLSMVYAGASFSLDGQWTTLHNSMPRHDSLSIRDLSIKSKEVSCDQGGWISLEPKPCLWASGTLKVTNSAAAALFVEGKEIQTGRFTMNNSNCSWTDEPPGTYWTAAGTDAPPYTPSCDRIDFENGEVWIKIKKINKVHIVSMSHLDVGYTGSIAFTLNSYFSDFFPRAIRVAKELVTMNATEKLHYITHPWLIYLYTHCDDLDDLHLDAPVTCPNETARAAFKDAVHAGTIVWHAGPMNMQAEWMTAKLFKFGINMSHTLDDIYGLPHKSVLSQRDVPGMTRSVVPLLKEMNVTGITVGMNGGVCPPWVPSGNKLFRWRVGGQDMVTAWHPGGYPDIYSCPGNQMLNCTEMKPGTLGRRECMLSGDHALCFAFRTDNTGPPISAEEVIAAHKVARTQFPMAEVKAGSLDEFFEVAQSDQELPVVTGEVGDVWIQGVQSDPRKASDTRRMQVAWDKYALDEELRKATSMLIKLGEHTWGLSQLYNASSNWSNYYTAKDLDNGSFDFNLRTWDEQRNFAKIALDAVPTSHPLKSEWGDILKRQAGPPNLEGFDLTHAREFEWRERGGIQYFIITSSGALLIDGLKIGELSYATRGEDVYNATSASCSGVLGGKKGSGAYGGSSATSVAKLIDVYKSDSANETSFWVKLSITGEGAPAVVWTRFTFTASTVVVKLVVLGKVSTRFNEAGWFSFEHQDGPHACKWSMEKLSYPVGFDEVVKGGSPMMHGVDRVRCGEGLRLESLDAPVLSALGPKIDPSDSIILVNQVTFSF